MPAPRLIARSMLSFGTEVFLAFWTASKRVGLPDMSAPPILAATSMFLMSLANDLARRLSMTAFLCLVVAHLEWPLTVLLYLAKIVAILAAKLRPISARRGRRGTMEHGLDRVEPDDGRPRRRIGDAPRTRAERPL